MFVYFWLCWVFLAAGRLSLVAASGDYSLLAMRRLLTAVVSLVADHKSVGSAVVVHRLKRLAACVIFPDQKLNPCSLHQQADS